MLKDVNPAKHPFRRCRPDHSCPSYHCSDSPTVTVEVSFAIQRGNRYACRAPQHPTCPNSLPWPGSFAQHVASDPIYPLRINTTPHLDLHDASRSLYRLQSVAIRPRTCIKGENPRARRAGHHLSDTRSTSASRQRARDRRHCDSSALGVGDRGAAGHMICSRCTRSRTR